MSLQGIFDPMVRAYFNSKGGGADDLIVAMATKSKYELKSDAVTSVADLAFYGNSDLTSVDFPNAKTVGNRAFDGCYSLVTVNLPSVTTLGEDALSITNSKVVTVNLQSLESVEKDLFYDYQNLKTIDIRSAKTIGTEAFFQCFELATVDLSSAETIGNNAFQNCGSLQKVDLPVAKSIGAEAFYGCSSLTAIIVRTTSQVCSVDLSALTGTPAMSGQGHVYIPASMYEAYRETYEPATGNMFSAIFRKIEDYPEICG